MRGGVGRRPAGAVRRGLRSVWLTATCGGCCAVLCFARQTLWNGNNWTPILSRAALRWAIVFWHEEHDVAVEVLRMVNDILWLHYPFYYMPDGTPVEGISYSYM